MASKQSCRGGRPSASDPTPVRRAARSVPAHHEAVRRSRAAPVYTSVSTQALKLDRTPQRKRATHTLTFLLAVLLIDSLRERNALDNSLRK